MSANVSLAGVCPDPSGGTRAVLADFVSLGSIAGTSLATVVLPSPAVLAVATFFLVRCGSSRILAVRP